MTTTYYINNIQVESDGAIGITVERYHSQDYWSVQLYLQGAFPSNIVSSIIPNTIGSIKIDDGNKNGPTIFTGTISYWASSIDYSTFDLLDCTLSHP
jgi:hypothetical protein